MDEGSHLRAEDSRDAPPRTSGTAPAWEAEHWAELQTLFHLAADAEPGKRTRILREATCDEELLNRVFDLLEDDDALSQVTASEVSGTAGPYRLLRLLGSGGFGAVYLAERMRGGAVQQCALKVLSLHVAGESVRSRFLREQQMLSTLDHPHIVRMQDAGFTQNHKPYLAMDYVNGTSITAYCDERRILIKERVRLFLDVCDAVSYAHRTLVVHLDLKPGNILVSQDGEVKLLDFGTAKLVADDAPTTTILATPAYASPEQLLNQPVTTACDVYGLGAVLYELLSGRRIWGDSSAIAVLERAFHGQEPPALGSFAESVEAAQVRGETSAATLSETLRGDLASIVARCLHHRSEDRFETANALREDLMRFLDGRPVLARPQRMGYRVVKFVRRRIRPLSAAGLALLCIGVALGYAVWRQQQAFREGRRAVQMQEAVSQIFKLANTNYMGKPAATVPEFLQLAVKVMPELIENKSDLLAARLTMAESMQVNGNFHEAQLILLSIVKDARAAGNVPVEAEAEAYAGNTAEELGDTSQAQQQLANALALIHQPGVRPSTRIDIERLYVQMRENEGFRTKENLRLIEVAWEESQQADITENQRADVELQYAKVLIGGHLEEANLHATNALRLFSREPYAVCQQADAAGILGLIRNQYRDSAGSLAYEKQAYEKSRQWSGDDSRATLDQQSFLAAAMLSAGKANEAIPMLEASLPQWRKLSGKDTDEMSAPLLFLTRAYIAAHEYPKAEGSARELLHGEDGRINPLSAQMGICQLVLAQALAGEGRTNEAFEHVEAADRAFRAENSQAKGTQHNAATARALLLDLQKKQASALKP